MPDMTLKPGGDFGVGAEVTIVPTSRYGPGQPVLTPLGTPTDTVTVEADSTIVLSGIAVGSYFAFVEHPTAPNYSHLGFIVQDTPAATGEGFEEAITADIENPDWTGTITYRKGELDVVALTVDVNFGGAGTQIENGPLTTLPAGYRPAGDATYAGSYAAGQIVIVNMDGTVNSPEADTPDLNFSTAFVAVV